MENDLNHNSVNLQAQLGAREKAIFSTIHSHLDRKTSSIMRKE